MFVNFNILNQLGSPAINSNTFANRPAAGQTGRLFVSTDTFEIYRDNGTTWDLIGGPGTSTITGTGQATEVAFFTSSQAIASSANLFWDNTNQYLGIGTSVPTAGVNVQDVDALGVLSNITTVAGTSTSSVSVWAKNTTNSSGYSGIFEEITPNSAAGQYPIKISHTLSSGTAAANMATGIHFGLPDNTGTERINQLSVDTVDPIAATYSNRYRFLLRSNGAAVTPFYITGTGLGVFTATPGAALDIHSTGIMAQLNSTSATANSLLAFQRSGSGLWRIGDQYNGGNNFFELHNTVLTNNAIQVLASSNEATFLSSKTYSTGNAIGVAVQHNLTIPNAVNVGLAAIGGVNSNLSLTLGGSTTVAATGRQGLEGSTTINFTGAGTLTMTQGSTVRAFSALSSVYAFNGSAVGTITHLAGLRICFPDNVGSAVNITNNYALLINNQTTGTGTVTYTNRWGIYQEGSLDTNYLNGTTLIGTTVNNGNKLQVTGTGFFSTSLQVGSATLLLTNNSGTTIGIGGINCYTATGNASIDLRAAHPTVSANIGGVVSFSSVYRNSDSDSTTIANIKGLREDSTNNLWRSYLSFETTNSDGFTMSEKMRITSAGLVGIRTNAPSGLLQLNGVLATPSDAANLTIKQSGTTFTDGIYLERTGERNGYYMYIGGAVDSLTFRRNYFGTQSDVMSLTRDGLVGIGTTNPSTLKVTIENNGGNLRLRNTNTRYRADFVMNTSELGINSYDDTAATYMPISIEGSKIQLQQGNVLIGTTTDGGYKLFNASNTLLKDTVLESRNNVATSNDYCFIFTTDGQAGGIRPAEAQHLFLQSRSTAVRDIGFVTGSTPLERFTIKGTGQARFVPLAADPAGAQAGDVYYNSGTNKLRLYDGTNWVNLN